ncbi:phosphate ABC transporter substrate-binding/OmpA family protein [Pseudomonas sp. RIT-PI-AD]|uniref:phosphate ABC transporter substrate-binding/OmpA family protein n=1 Tax=Pseudomonas sp. RIT-PI-AD TaxID=3035294 RepID=UPI0021DB603D|nr:phosphate ABC transporter substrate-binding/OmpA family protein [Pseudomonas sp. RIT-PI-AD]
MLAPLPTFAALTGSADGHPVLRIEGSNTIGSALSPALVKGLMQQENFQDIRQDVSADPLVQRVTGKAANGQVAIVEIAGKGSSSGFGALQANGAQLVASARPISASEAALFKDAGDMHSDGAEQVIALDGLAIVLHPNNPLQQISRQQLAAVFAGEIKTWEELGGKGGAIMLYAMPADSGSYQTFTESVLAPQGKSMSAGTILVADSAKLAEAVGLTPQAMGFVGQAYSGKLKTLAIAETGVPASLPSAAAIGSETYPLSRRLYFYSRPHSADPWAKALLEFTQSPKGQAIVAQHGFIAQTVEASAVAPTADMPEAYRSLAGEARKLSLHLRFKEDSAKLDSKSMQDLPRLLDYLKQQDKLQRKVVLVGFGDAKADPARTALLSKLRAMEVSRQLGKNGVIVRDILALGDALPVAGNDSEEGRLKNRRVELWVY